MFTSVQEQEQKQSVQEQKQSVQVQEQKHEDSDRSQKQFVLFVEYTKDLFKMTIEHRNTLLTDRNKLASIVLNTNSSSCDKIKSIINTLIEINLKPIIDVNDFSDPSKHIAIDEHMMECYHKAYISTFETMTKEQIPYNQMIKGIREILKDTSITNHDEKIEKIKILLL